MKGEDVRLDVRLARGDGRAFGRQGHGRGPDRRRHALGRPDVLGRQVARGSPTTTSSQVIQQSVAGAVTRAHRRGAHPRPARRVHVLRRRRAGAQRRLGQPERAVRSVHRELDQLPDRRLGRGVRQQERRHHRRRDAHPHGRLSHQRLRLRRLVRHDGQSLSASANAGKMGILRLRLAAVHRHAARAGDASTPSRSSRTTSTTTARTSTASARSQYNPSPSDVLNLEGNWSRTNFQVPFDSTGGATAGRQPDRRQRVPEPRLAAPVRRRGGCDRPRDAGRRVLRRAVLPLRQPSVHARASQDRPQFIFYPGHDALQPSREPRLHDDGAEARLLVSAERQVRVQDGRPDARRPRATRTSSRRRRRARFGPASNSGLNGNDFGVYAQTVWSPSEHFELRTGVRYDDAHARRSRAPASQLSPRVRLNFFLDPANTFYLYYGRLFIPTNVEDLRAITSVAQAGVVDDRRRCRSATTSTRPATSTASRSAS